MTRWVLGTVLAAFVALCVFILAKWLIPLLFGLVGFGMPDQISTVIALLIAAGVIFYWRPV